MDESHKFTSQTTITNWEAKLLTFINNLGGFLIWASPRLLEIIHSRSEDIIEEIRRSIADESQPSKENKSKSCASNVSTRSKNLNWEQDLRDIFEEDKATMISDIDKSIFIEDFGLVSLQYGEVLDEVTDDDQKSKSKFEWMNIREHESWMSRKKMLI